MASDYETFDATTPKEILSPPGSASRWAKPRFSLSPPPWQDAR